MCMLCVCMCILWVCVSNMYFICMYVFFMCMYVFYMCMYVSILVFGICAAIRFSTIFVVPSRSRCALNKNIVYLASWYDARPIYTSRLRLCCQIKMLYITIYVD